MSLLQNCILHSMAHTSITQNPTKVIRLKRAERTSFLRQRYGVLSDIARKLKVSQGLVTRVSLGQATSRRVAGEWNAEVERWRANRAAEAQEVA